MCVRHDHLTHPQSWPSDQLRDHLGVSGSYTSVPAGRAERTRRQLVKASAQAMTSVVAVQLGLVVGITLRDVVPPVPPRRRDRATVSRCSRGDLDNVVGAGDFEGVDDVVGLLI